MNTDNMYLVKTLTKRGNTHTPSTIVLVVWTASSNVYVVIISSKKRKSYKRGRFASMYDPAMGYKRDGMSCYGVSKT